ncbi:MAG: hypothetical protein H7Y11_13900, partial [Armatimonadetes bacterium]|nr:hypothetical protein [Anaerolineae bacterium]
MPHRPLVALRVVILLTIISVLIISSAQAQQLIPLPASGQRAITELLTNPSFETDSDGDKLPDNWAGSNTATAAADKQICDKPDKPVAHTGTCAFQFKGNPDASSSALVQTIVDTSAITNGATLTFSAYIDPRSSTPGTAFGKAQLKFSDTSKQKFALTITGGDDYVLVSDVQPVVIPAGATISKAKVKFTYNQTSGKFLIDDVGFALGTVDATATASASSTVTHTATAQASATTTNTPLTATEQASLTATHTPVAPTATDSPMTATNTATLIPSATHTLISTA